MKMIINLLITASMLLTLTGCNRRVPTRTVCLVDTSRSIDPQGVQYEFGVVDSLVGRLERGDTLTVIPISGNAMNDTSGRVLTFTASLERQAYDHDLVVMRQTAHERINTMRSATTRRPALRTDILGALDAANEVFEQSDSRQSATENRSLIVLSDFIEDDGTLNFVSDRKLSLVESARILAAATHENHPYSLAGTRVRLISVDSSDRRTLSSLRQHAISEFWREYFKTANAEAEIQIASTDV